MLTDRLRIYQLPVQHPFKFRPMTEWNAANTRPRADAYTCVYESTLPEDTSLSPEEVFCRFNADDRPDGFRGHSLSVSDIVVIDRDGLTTAYICNSIGFTTVEDFFYKASAPDGTSEFRSGYSQAMKDLNTPMTPVQKAWTHSECPRCGGSFVEFEENDDGYVTRCTTLLRCPFCGQKLSWDS